MFHLVYVSVAETPFSDAALSSLLVQARHSNVHLDITGLLLYRPDAFMQLLEGEEKVVRNLYASIRRDVRHHDAVMLVASSIQIRQFPDWTMGFRKLESESFRPLVEPHGPRICPGTYWTERGGIVASKLFGSFKDG